MAAPGGTVRTALTIAGSDSSGGAGVQADLKTFSALGVYGLCALTAVTAQNTLGVTASYPLDPDLVAKQIETVAGDIAVHATKTGMLATASIVRVVAAAIDRFGLANVVVDPVMVAKSGDPLLDAQGVEALRSELLPRALLVTPNIPEAEFLTGRSIRSDADMREAARIIHRMGPRAVVVTGGHGATADLVDLLFDGVQFHAFRTARVDTRNTHGTGCTFASAITAYLVRGDSLPDATSRAQIYVAGAIRNGVPLGRGHGPLDHFWQTGSARILDP